MNNNSTDTFEKVPHRIRDALEEGELTPDQFLLLVYIILKVNHVTGKATLSLPAIEKAIGWHKSTEWLRKTLRSLEEKGWLTVEKQFRGSSAYVFRRKRAAIAAVEPKNGLPDSAEVPPQFRRSSVDVPPNFRRSSADVPSTDKGEKVQPTF